jgi:uncharacterized protein (TIGR02118 family)
VAEVADGTAKLALNPKPERKPKMLKMVFIAHRKPGMDEKEFHRYWKETHAPIAAKIPGLRKYVQRHAVAGAEGAAPPIDGISEMWFDGPEALETPEAQAAIADTANFLDVERSPGFAFDEVVIV